MSQQRNPCGPIRLTLLRPNLNRNVAKQGETGPQGIVRFSTSIISYEIKYLDRSLLSIELKVLI